jgi:hypothetical protein
MSGLRNIILNLPTKLTGKHCSQVAQIRRTPSGGFEVAERLQLKDPATIPIARV